MTKTNIEWADKSLNFYNWKCDKVSAGCKNCYMMAFARRMGKNPIGTPEWRKTARKEYLALKSGDVVFVNSMSDTYHEKVDRRYIHWIHNYIWQRPDVTFLLLTKRPHIAYGMRHTLKWSPNLWLGTSIESPEVMYRLAFLVRTPAAGHFVSAEPLLSQLNGIEKYMTGHTVKKIDWLIAGAESGDNRRPMNLNWVRHLRNLSLQNNIPFMYKQGSHRFPSKNRVLDDRTWDESPFGVNA